jgi:hypothetical protein
MKSGMKIFAIIVLLFLVLALAGCKVPLKEEPEDVRECIADEDCAKAQIGCCACSMGGQEKCVSVAELSIYKKLVDECPKDIVCTAQYNCIPEKCVCINSTCQVFQVPTNGS